MVITLLVIAGYYMDSVEAVIQAVGDKHHVLYHRHSKAYQA